jgi:hypothetical protein
MGSHLFCGVAMLAGYLTQLMLCNESIGEMKRGRHMRPQWTAVAFALLSLLSFGAASYVAGERFPSGQAIPPCADVSV